MMIMGRIFVVKDCFIVMSILGFSICDIIGVLFNLNWCY